MKLESYQIGWIERLWLKFEARSADKHTEHVVMLLPVLLFMQKSQLETLLDELPKILSLYLKPHLVQRVFRHIIIKLQEYTKHEQLFLQERQKAFECLAENIQLYAIVLDMFADKLDSLALIESAVRKEFDETYKLSKKNLRLLAYQEKHCNIKE